MKVSSKCFFLILLPLALLQTGAARHAQYDEEAREEERLGHQPSESATTYAANGPVRGMARGVKEATVDSTAELLSDTVEGTADDAPLRGTVDGAREGSGKAVDKAVKGAFKIATLGYGNAKKVDVEEPEKGTDDVTKFRIGL
jgi:hypothetical protein